MSSSNSAESGVSTLTNTFADLQLFLSVAPIPAIDTIVPELPPAINTLEDATLTKDSV